MTSKITPKHYDFDKKDYIEGEPVSIDELTIGMGIEEMTSLLSDWCNKGGKDFRVGLDVGKNLMFYHRTAQGLVGRLCLGILVGLGEQEFTDARNEKIVALGKQLNRMIKNKELDMGYMI